MVALVVVGTTPAFAAAKPNPKTELLTVADLPAGWSTTTTSKSTATGCGEVGKALEKGSRATARGTYDLATVPEVQEYIAAYATAAKAKASLAAITAELNGCTSYAVSGGTVSVGPLSFPHYGTSSFAWSFSLTEKGITVAQDVVIALKASQVILVSYANIGTPDRASAEAVTKKAVAKVSA
jgi:hypothetical protein